VTPTVVPPLIAAAGVRIDVAGTPVVDGVSFASTGQHVLVFGAARALFEASAGLRPVVRGELLIDGVPARAAVRSASASCAPLDPAMPSAWTLREYATWSARVAGQSRAVARTLAAEALDQVRLGSLSSTKLGAAALATRRGTVLAAALATGARTLVIDDPLAGLPDDVARTFARVVARALEDRRTVVFAGRAALDSPLALAADEAIVLDGSQRTAQGPPAEIAAAGGVIVRVAGDVAAFARGVEAHGGRAFVTPGAPPPVHVAVELGGELAARDLFRIAAESGAIVAELRPRAGPFA
jgi:ABC-type multidrug transport system ATPase subunit